MRETSTDDRPRDGRRRGSCRSPHATRRGPRAASSTRRARRRRRARAARATFAVRRGEIVGIAGVEGNGQTTLGDAIAGSARIPARSRSTAARCDAARPKRDRRGNPQIPQDRSAKGSCSPGAWRTTSCSAITRAPATHAACLLRSRAHGRARRDVVERFDVRASFGRRAVQTLSGGNQQKIVVGRALARRTRLVLAYQPTRGIDVGAAALVQSRLIKRAMPARPCCSCRSNSTKSGACRSHSRAVPRTFAAEFERDAFDRGRIGAADGGGRMMSARER